MINLEWVQHRSALHEMVPAPTNIKDSEGNVLVTSYAVHRPDGNWSLMLGNRDVTNPHPARVVLEDSAARRKGGIYGTGHAGHVRQRTVRLES